MFGLRERPMRISWRGRVRPSRSIGGERGRRVRPSRSHRKRDHIDTIDGSIEATVTNVMGRSDRPIERPMRNYERPMRSYDS